MRTNLWAILGLIAVTSMAVTTDRQEPCALPPAPAPIGCNTEGTCVHCQNCANCRLINEMVPIKKIVYSTKCVPVCELHPGGHCDCGPTCKLFYKNVLVKKEIVVGYKCVAKCVLQ